MVVPKRYAGLPVIASDRVGCVEDLVIPEQTGLVFPTGDEDSLRCAVCRRCVLGIGESYAGKNWVGRRFKTWRRGRMPETTQGLLAALDAIYIDRAQRKPWFG